MAAPENQLTRYGAVAKALAASGRLVAPNAKVFFVGSSSLPSFNDFAAAFPVDKDGGTRVFTTIAAAIADSNVVAARGDVLLVLPGHTETMTAAGTVTVSKSGLTILGLGNGNARPTISYSTAVGASFDITAANVHIEGLVFDGTGIDALTAMVNVQAAGVTITACRFINASASAQATLCVLTNASASVFKFTDNVVSGTTDAGTTAALRLVGGDTVLIQGNSFIGAYGSGNGAIENITTAVTNLVIKDNLINNETASSTKAIVLLAGTSGHAANNRMQILSGTAPITGAGLSWVGGNYYAATIATAGTLI